MIINVDKDELLMMMREFWVIDNNDNCLKETIIFCRRIGLSDIEIKTCLSLPPDEGLPKLNNEDREIYEVALKDQLNYYSKDK